MKIALIMLAAGNSRRFGSNKLLYEIEGKPMYRHILEKLMIVAEWLEETECIEKVECGGSFQLFPDKAFPAACLSLKHS